MADSVMYYVVDFYLNAHVVYIIAQKFERVDVEDLIVGQSGDLV